MIKEDLRTVMSEMSYVFVFSESEGILTNGRPSFEGSKFGVEIPELTVRRK